MKAEERKQVDSYLRKLQCFLYLLVRDYMTFGEINLLVREISGKTDRFVFSDSLQAKWSLETAKSLLGESEVV
ncbi:hypothetical protein DRO41_00010 [Candidatus Bathyarchaeota archaeon]|nr:MAG: hypothetical protein DRO41_00010 [Candidatus Bathyarchaeota archaeon]